MKLKNIKLHVLNWLLSYKSDSIDKEEVSTVVVYCPTRIGDTVAAFPMIEYLSKQEGISLYLVCQSYNESILRTVSCSKLFVLENDRSAIKSYFLGKNIRKEIGYIDLLLDATGPNIEPTTLAFVGALKARCNVGRDLKVPELYSHISKAALKVAGKRIIPCEYSALMQALGFNGVKPSYGLSVPIEIQSEVKGLLVDMDEYVCINLDGFDKCRQFNVETAKYLLKSIINRIDINIVFLASPQNNSKLNEVANIHPRAKKIEPLSSFFHVAEVVRGCKFMISPDTSILHLSSAYNVPQIGFYNNYCPSFGLDSDVQELVTCERYDINEFSKVDFENALERLLGKI